MLSGDAKKLLIAVGGGVAISMGAWFFNRWLLPFIPQQFR